MTAPVRDPLSADDPSALRVRWLSGASLRLHAAMAAGVGLSGGATWLEWSRAQHGHPVAWVYTFEWPLFAVLGIYLWWRLLHTDAKEHEPSVRRPEIGATPDPDLLAWQAYLARLHEIDPPGGPPQR